MRIIVKAVPERLDCIKYLKKHLPNAEFCLDEKRSAIDTLLRSLVMCGKEPCIFLEEDIILTEDFEKKAEKVIRQRPMNFINFFSMRKADLEIGSRWDNNFLMAQCYYAPPNHSLQLLSYFGEWRKMITRTESNHSVHTGTDIYIRDFLKSRKEKYWIHCPSLVDHRIMKSAIDSRRSSKRQSFTFQDPIK